MTIEKGLIFCINKHLMPNGMTKQIHLKLDKMTGSMKDFPPFLFKKNCSFLLPMSYAAACSAFQPAPSTSLPAYINPDSPSPPHFCLVSESSTSVEGRADKMVSNCSTDDVALKFQLSLSFSLCLSFLSLHGLNGWASLMLIWPLLSS